MSKSQPSKKIFLSMVTKDFEEFRKVLTKDLRRSLWVEVKVQEDFDGEPGTLLDKLDKYIQHCDWVVHLIGRSSGYRPQRAEVDRILALYPDLGEKVPCLRRALATGGEYDLSFTQWEAYLALYHHGPKGLVVLQYHRLKDPANASAADEHVMDESQQLHYQRLLESGQDCTGRFSDPRELSTITFRILYESRIIVERPTPRWGWRLSNLVQQATAAVCRRWHALHRMTRPARRSLGEEDAVWFWMAAMLRLGAVWQAAAIFRTFWVTLDFDALQYDQSLAGQQRYFLLGWIEDFRWYHLALVVLLVLGYCAASPRLWQRLSQMRKLWATRKERPRLWVNPKGPTRLHELAAKIVDSLLMPFELTIVLPMIPVAAKQWIDSVERMPPVNEIDPTLLAFAGIAACEALLAAVELARHWPTYRHLARGWQHGKPAALLLTVASVFGLWLLFDPLFLPTGTVATFRAQGSEVTHLAADDADADQAELAIASRGPRVSAKYKTAVTIQIADFATLSDKHASFGHIPWSAEKDEGTLLRLALHGRKLFVQNGPLSSTIGQRFFLWDQDKPLIDKGCSGDYTLDGKSIGAFLDHRGRVLGCTTISGAAMLMGEEYVPRIVWAPAVCQPLQPLEAPWFAHLTSVRALALSDDGTLLAVSGTVPPDKPPPEQEKPPEVINPFLDGPVRADAVALIETGTGTLRWSYPKSAAELHFSPRNELMLVEYRGSGLLEPFSSMPLGIEILDAEGLSSQAIAVQPPSARGDFPWRSDIDWLGRTSWSPSGRHIAVRFDYALQIYSVQQEELVKSFISPRGKFTCHAFSPDGQFVAAGGDEGRVWLYRVAEP